MRGVSITQAIVAHQISKFLTIEILRSTTGTAGAVNLNPMPIVVGARKKLENAQCLMF